MFFSRILLVADDFLESKIQNSIAEHLPSTLLPELQLGLGKRTTIPFADLSALAERCDCVAVTMSDWCDNEVRAARLAAEHRKPLVCIALAYGAWKNTAFSEVRDYASVLFVLDANEAKKAARYFRSAKIVVTGNPEWESFAKPAHSRNEVRKKLDMLPGEKLVLIAGEKSLRVNMPLAACIIEALGRLQDDANWHVHFAVHPGHEELPAVDLVELYHRELCAYDKRVPVTVSCKNLPYGIGAPDMVAGADLVVGTTSTLQIQAAFLEIPALSIFLRPNIGYDTPSSADCWAPVEARAVAGVYDLSAKTAAAHIRKLITREGYEPMRKAQAHMFKKMPEGYALHTICSHLEELCRTPQPA